MKYKTPLLTMIMGLIFIFGVIMLINNGKQPLDLTSALAAEIIIEPTQSDSAGVSTTSQFVLKTSTYIDPKVVAENINVQPEIKLLVEDQKKTGKIILTPKEPLEANALYQFTLDLPGSHPLKWAFQTKGEFKINGTLPRDKSTGVPTNTGIEISFSHTNFEDIEKNFEIFPKTKGRFERHKKTAVFVPEILDPGTVYTVKLKKGLELIGSDVALAEDFVFQFETQDPAQHNQNEAHFEFFTNNMEFTATEAPVISLGYYRANDNSTPSAKVSLYKFPDGEAYIKSIQERETVPYWAYFSRSQYLGDTKELEQVESFSVNLKRYEGETFLEFPQPLKTGYYLSEVQIGSIVRQIWLQITDLAVYTSVGDNKTIVWVNNLLGGNPVANASITILEKEEKVYTDDQGMTEIETPEMEDTGIYVTVRWEEKEAVAVILPNRFIPFSEKGSNILDSQAYWKYLYLDRGLYKPDDTIHFWGFIKGRERYTDTPRKLNVSLTKWLADEQVAIEEKQLDVAENVFAGEMVLPDLIPGYYNLTVKAEDVIIAQQGFDVQTYTKPAYRIDVVSEKKAILVGEIINFNIAATCFEDTPVPKVSLKYNLDHSGELVTDEKGQVQLSYTPEYRMDDFGAVQYRHIYLHANLPESGEITAGTSVIVLNNDIRINAEGEIRDNKGKINIEVDKLTVEKVNRGEVDPWEEDAFLAGKGTVRPVTAHIFRQEWDRVEDGTYYDFINKTVMKRFRYHERKVPVDKIQVITDKKGKAELSFAAEEKKSYWVQLTAQDGNNNQAKTEIYLSGGAYPQFPGNTWYYLEDKKTGRSKYQQGEQIELTVKNNQNIVPDRKESFLFYTAQKGIRDYKIQDSGTFERMFSLEDIPNYWVRGVYFDGRTYHETFDHLVAFDEQEKGLQIKIMTDKDEYKPKEKVHLSVEVQDKEGRPVAANINLSLVDEAIFALNSHDADVLRSLYEDYLSSGILMTASTHKDLANNYGGAEQGGEGGSGRQDFKDTALFQTITTGKNGKASTSFIVPDNLTSWRLSCQAVTRDLKAAGTTKKITVRLPFFTDMIISDRYLAGDRPVINIRSLGVALTEDQEIAYHVKVTGNKEIYNDTFTGKAFLSLPVALPALPEGEYQITVTASGGGYRDTLTRSFQVAESYMTQVKTDFQLLTAQTLIDASSVKPVTITFADANRSQYLSALCSLSGVEGSRVEHKIVPVLAQELLKHYFPKFDHRPLVLKPDLSSYQTQDGGIAILPYGDSDLEVSSRIAPWAEDYFDAEALKMYFIQLINDPKESRERGIVALYGLAALGEAVLQEVELALKEKDLALKEQLFLILALNQMGNEQPARKMLKELIKEFGEAHGPYMQMNSGSDKDDVIKNTVLTALAAGRLMFAERDKLYRYVKENSPEDELIYLDEIVFLQENIGKIPTGEYGFNYTLEGKTHNIKLEQGETFSLVLAPEKLRLLSFQNIKGEVGVTSLYQGVLDPSGESLLDGVSIARDYQIAGKSTRRFSPGDLVEVKVTWNIGGKAPSGVYRITDYLPSGLKLVEKPYNWDVVKNNMGWPVEVDGQKAVFLVSGKGTLSYYARIINQGTYAAENMTVQHVNNGKIYSMTGLDKVEIN